MILLQVFKKIKFIQKKQMFNPRLLFNYSSDEVRHIVKKWNSELNFHWYDPIQYFSTWNICAFLLFPTSITWLQQIKFFMLLQTSLVGMYMTYVYPRVIKIHYLQLECDSFILQIIDSLFHQLPFFYSLLFHPYYPLESRLEKMMVHVPILFYISQQDFFHLYQVRDIDFRFLLFMYLFCFGIA